MRTTLDQQPEPLLTRKEAATYLNVKSGTLAVLGLYRNLKAPFIKAIRAS